MRKKLLYSCFLITLLLTSFYIQAQEQAGLNFDGVDDYIQTDYPGISGSAARTVEFWMNTVYTGTNTHTIISWGGEGTSPDDRGGQFDVAVQDGKIRLLVWWGQVKGDIVVNDGNWHHISVTHDPTIATNKVKIYVDGVLDGQGNANNGGYGVDTDLEIDLRIGQTIKGGNFFQGNVDDVRVWDITRTQAEIQNSMEQEPCENGFSGLMLYYNFNEGIPSGDNSNITTITDQTENNYIGVMNDFNLEGESSNYVEGKAIESSDIDSGISIVNNALVANQEGATYQWIDCFATNPYIEGETDQTFIPENNGSYAVQITLGACQQFSECIEFEVLCHKPTDITLLGISDDGVTVLWDEPGTAEEWNIRYGTPGFDPYVTEATTINSTNPDKIEDIHELTPETSYDIYVQSVCGGDNGSSAWAGPINFATIATSCFAPENISISNITPESAEIVWTETGDASQWNISYGPTGFNPENEGEGQVIDINSNPTTLTNLESNTSYDVYLQALCDGNDTSSSWSGPENFTTEMLSLAIKDFENFNFYPNPVKDKLMLSAANIIRQITIYNLLGQKVIETNINQLHTDINIGSLKSGAYLLKVNIEGASKVFKLIKR